MYRYDRKLIPLFSVINLDYNGKYVAIRKLYAQKFYLIPIHEAVSEPSEVSMQASKLITYHTYCHIALLKDAFQMRIHEPLSWDNIGRSYADRKCKYKFIQLQIYSGISTKMAIFD